MADRTILYQPLDDLVEAMHEENEKGHAVEKIEESIDRFGYTSPPEIDERTGKLAAGHGRVEALAILRDAGEDPPDGVRVSDAGSWLVPTLRGWASRDDDEARAYRIGNNQTVIAGGWRGSSLSASLAKLLAGPGFSGTGYDEADAQRLIARFTASAPTAFPVVSPGSVTTTYRCPNCDFEWSGKPA